MRRTPLARAALGTLILPTAVALAACGHSSSSKSSSSSSSSKPSSSSSAAAAGGGNCSGGFVSAQIGGQQKCLQNGQLCQEQNASDYKKYGFECTKTNGREQLQKK